MPSAGFTLFSQASGTVHLLSGASQRLSSRSKLAASLLSGRYLPAPLRAANLPNGRTAAGDSIVSPLSPSMVAEAWQYPGSPGCGSTGMLPHLRRSLSENVFCGGAAEVVGRLHASSPSFTHGKL